MKYVFTLLLLLCNSAAQAAAHGSSPCVAQTQTLNGVNYVLSYCDQFFGSSSSLVSPSNPAAKYFPTRPYGISGGPGVGLRFIATDVAYQTDPFHTGFFDSNRGVAVGYNTVRQSSGAMTLQGRLANNAEYNAFSNGPLGLQNLSPFQASSTIHTAGAIGLYPTTGAAMLVEARIRWMPAGVPPGGWGGAFWLFSGAPMAINGTADEFDIVEFCPSCGNTIQFANHVWSGGQTTGGAGTVCNYATTNFRDGNYHTFSLAMVNNATATVYIDGVSTCSVNTTINTTSKPLYVLLSAFVDGGANFVQSAWTASGTTTTSGAWMDVAWLKVWRQSGLPHYAPLQTVSDLNLSYSGTGTITLPSKTALWNDSTVTEYVQCIPDEENEPGSGPASAWAQFPSYVTYNSGTRVISVDFSGATGRAGILHCTSWAYQATGATFEPLRFNINRAPNITSTLNNATLNIAYVHDFYFDCDVGIMTPKTMNVTGLPTGMSFSGTTISGTPSQSGTFNLSVSCTNNNSQQTSTTVPLVVNVSWGGPSSGLTHRWTMSDANVSGATITDVVGSLNGTGGSGLSSVAGPSGQARAFDGTANAYISLASNALPAWNTAHSVFGWVKITNNAAAAAGGGRQTFWTFSVDANNGVSFADSFSSPGAIILSFKQGGSQIGVNSSSSNLLSTQFSHVGYTWDGSSTLVLYQNGAAIGTTTVENISVLNANIIGNRAASDNTVALNGAIYNLVTYNRALSSSDVAQLYTAQ